MSYEVAKDMKNQKVVDVLINEIRMDVKQVREKKKLI
jgi:hypothetical protein